jgi:spore coat protein U-like protein
MKSAPWRLAAALLFFFCAQAHAMYSCSVSSSGFSQAYDPTLAANTVVPTSFTINCTRATGDTATMNYSLAANNGLSPKGINNQASFGANLLRYDIYQDSLCGTQWKGNNTFSGSLNFGGNTSASVTGSYWGCILSGQTGAPAGTYTDTVTMTLSYGPNPQSTATSTFPVNIATPSQCNISTPPGTVAFGTYVAYQSTTLQATPSTFGVTCTNYLPYTLALDVSTGVIAGVTYNLALSAASGTGVGVQQLLSITGTMAPGQAGICSTGTCSGANSHTLTITY